MKREKVKEIKNALKLGAEIGMSTQSETFIIDVKVSDILTYINELESENERLNGALVENLKAYNAGYKDAAGCIDKLLNEITK